MTGKRKHETAKFKAKIALAALRGDLTVSQLAAKHDVHQTMISGWKRQAMEGLSAVFSGRAEARDAARDARWRRCTRISDSCWWKGTPDQVGTSFLAKASGR